MATWSPDNVVLTSVGQAILSKVQAGVGGITVSRIVTGSTYISPALLYKQTAVSGIQQTCTIVETNTDENGSEIAVTFSNKDLTVPYDLYTIGVYVTHPDYTGEQLYMIAECNQADPDSIPVPGETPVTLYYSLYLEHAGAASVTITVDPTGMVSVEDLLELKANIVFISQRDEALTPILENARVYTPVDNNGQALAPRTVASAITYGETNVEQALNNLIASGNTPYDPSSTYALGAYCSQSGVMYKCTTAITTPEAWTVGHWTKTSVGVELQAAAADLTSHTGNKQNPHEVTKGQVGLGNVPNVATNDQTPTYTAATTLATLTSGEKLSVAMGKIAKAIAGLVSHIADTTKHITAAERTAWNGKAEGSHTHDSRYYTESEMNTKLAGKSDTNHNHAGMSINPSSIELNPSTSAGHGGYIDFHFNGDAADCTSRIWETAKGVLKYNDHGILSTANIVALYNAQITFENGVGNYYNSAIKSSSVTFVQWRAGAVSTLTDSVLSTTPQNGSMIIIAKNGLTGGPLPVNILIINQ